MQDCSNSIANALEFSSSEAVVGHQVIMLKKQTIVIQDMIIQAWNPPLSLPHPTTVLIHCPLVAPYGNNTGSGNGLLPDGTKPLS